MLLTISTTHQPATDLGYLLYKHPDKVQRFSLAFGEAHVYYPEASETRCTVALLLDINPLRLSKRGSQGSSFALKPYVNDHPYVLSSFMSVAIAQVFGTALAGRCKDRSELVDCALPFAVRLTSLPCSSEEMLQRLFAPLGYTMTLKDYPLDSQFPAWGQSRYYQVTLQHTITLQQLLRHLYVLIPVLDNDKHYWVNDAEVKNLLHKGEGWLETHPDKKLIARRYLNHQGSLAKDVLRQLELRTDESEEDSNDDIARNVAENIATPTDKESSASTPNLHEQRLKAVQQVIKAAGATRVLDLGCGEGKLMRRLLKDKQFQEVVAMDVSPRLLDKAAQRLQRMPDKVQERARLLQGSLLYRDARLEGFDAAAIVEVIEHLEPFRLDAFAHSVFGYAKPRVVVLTTPNREYNVIWERLPAGKFRHKDHRFEWSRAEFQQWAQDVAKRFGYTVTFSGIGEEAEGVGHPSQMAIFEVTTGEVAIEEVVAEEVEIA